MFTHRLYSCFLWRYNGGVQPPQARGTTQDTPRGTTSLARSTKPNACGRLQRRVIAPPQHEATGAPTPPSTPRTSADTPPPTLRGDRDSATGTPRAKPGGVTAPAGARTARPGRGALPSASGGGLGLAGVAPVAVSERLRSRGLLPSSGPLGYNGRSSGAKGSRHHPCSKQCRRDARTRQDPHAHCHLQRLVMPPLTHRDPLTKLNLHDLSPGPPHACSLSNEPNSARAPPDPQAPLPDDPAMRAQNPPHR